MSAWHFLLPIWSQSKNKFIERLSRSVRPPKELFVSKQVIYHKFVIDCVFLLYLGITPTTCMQCPKHNIPRGDVGDSRCRTEAIDKYLFQPERCSHNCALFFHARVSFFLFKRVGATDNEATAAPTRLLPETLVELALPQENDNKFDPIWLNWFLEWEHGVSLHAHSEQFRGSGVFPGIEVRKCRVPGHWQNNLWELVFNSFCFTLS